MLQIMLIHEVDFSVHVLRSLKPLNLIFFFIYGFHSMPQVGIQQVSLKACRRWDSTCHRMMIVSQIDELLDPLDSGHRDSPSLAL